MGQSFISLNHSWKIISKRFDEIYFAFLLKSTFLQHGFANSEISRFFFCNLWTDHSGHLKSDNQKKKPSLVDWLKIRENIRIIEWNNVWNRTHIVWNFEEHLMRSYEIEIEKKKSGPICNQKKHKKPLLYSKKKEKVLACPVLSLQ